MTDSKETYTANCQTTVEATPDIAFAAWSDPRMLEVWMAHRESGGSDKPHLIAVRNVEIEPRVGAPVRIDMITREPNGDERTWIHHGQVMEASAPSRLTFTWISKGTNHATTLFEVDFAPRAAGGTDLHLRHTGFATQKMATGHAEGWDIFLELFSEAMVAAATASAKVTAAWLKKQLADRKKRLSAQTAAREEKEKGLKEGA